LLIKLRNDPPRGCAIDILHCHPFHRLYNEAATLRTAAEELMAEASARVAEQKQKSAEKQRAGKKQSKRRKGRENKTDQSPAQESVAAGTRLDNFIRKLSKDVATALMETQWEAYREKRRLEQRPGHMVPAPAEAWGEKSLRYYHGLSRAQSTMLLQCRTGFIGLRSRLYKLKKV
jgi:hypothetical protein